MYKRIYSVYICIGFNFRGSNQNRSFKILYRREKGEMQEGSEFRPDRFLGVRIKTDSAGILRERFKNAVFLRSIEIKTDPAGSPKKAFQIRGFPSKP